MYDVGERVLRVGSLISFKNSKVDKEHPIAVPTIIASGSVELFSSRQLRAQATDIL